MRRKVFHWGAVGFSGLVLLGASACSSLLDIKDVHEGPEPGAGASSAGANSGGASGNSPTAGATHNGGAPSGGAASMAGKGGTSDDGGLGGDGEAGGPVTTAGSAGTAGSSSSVTGHLIDFWGHQLSDVEMEVDGKPVTTDANGAFTVAAVGPEYDASLVVVYDVNGRIKTRAWVFQGLTRRDPTLQIYEALTYKEGYLDVLPNHPVALTDARTLSVSLGGPDGERTFTEVSGAGTDGSTVLWEGPPTTQVTAHALIWEKDQNHLPSKFWAYDSVLVGLSSLVATHAKATLDLTADTIAAANISGTVSGPMLDSPTNQVFLRFTSNAELQLVREHPTVAGYSYTVPSGIAGASVTVAAANGDAYGAYSLAHKDGLIAGAAMVNLTLPTPASQPKVVPTADLNAVKATTQFGFTLGSTKAYVAVLTNDDYQDHDDILYIVSAKPPPFALPKVVGGMYAPQAGGSYHFRVETHGAPASVDAMAGPGGFLDEFSNGSDADTPSGPRAGDGSYSLSNYITVKIAP